MKNRLCTRLTALLSAAALLTGLCGAHAVETAPASVHADYWGGSVYVNGDIVAVDEFQNEQGTRVPLFSYCGTVYMPLSTAVSWLDRQVAWESESHTVAFSAVAEAPAEGLDAPQEGPLTWEQVMVQTATWQAEKDKGMDVQLDPGITVTLDGVVQRFVNVNGETVYPAVYQGTVYLPLRSIGTLLGMEVAYESRAGYGAKIFLRTSLSDIERAQLEEFLEKAVPLSDRMIALNDQNSGVDPADTAASAARLAELTDILRKLNDLPVPKSCFATVQFATFKREVGEYLELLNRGEEPLINADIACQLLPQRVEAIQIAYGQQQVVPAYYQRAFPLMAD